MKRSFLIILVIFSMWFFSTIFYSSYKTKIFNDSLHVHDNILVIKNQIADIVQKIDDFYHDYVEEGKKEDFIYNINPDFIQQIENIIASLNYNLVRYGCSKCHSPNDVFMKRLFVHKNELAKSLSNFKEQLTLFSQNAKYKSSLIPAKKSLTDSIYNLKNDLDSMEKNLHDTMLQRLSVYQKIELSTNIVSLLLVFILAIIFYRKVLRDVVLLQKIVKNIDENKDIGKINLRAFNSKDLRGIAKALIDSFKKLKDNELRLKSHIEEMESMNEELQASNQQMEMVTAELEEIKSNLERKVQEKTRELEEAYKELERSEAVKSSFLQSISHEFKTPLTPLFGYLKLMKNKELGDLTPLQEQSLSIMLTCAEKIYNTIDDLILLTKLDIDKENFFFKDLDLNLTAKAVSSRVEKELEEKHIKLHLDLPEIPIVIKGEQLILIQTILHLLRNSIKYTPEGGTITISLNQEDGRAVLRVKDTGHGIPEKILKEINDYFETKSYTITKKGDTITVGLSILKRVSLLHNCKVTYKSEKNRGTTVELSFPIKG